MFSIGNRVNVDGDLYEGAGTVEWFGMQTDGSRHARPGQPWPQVSVRCDDRKLRHYNGRDLANGKVTLDNAPTMQAAPPTIAQTQQALAAVANRDIPQGGVQFADDGGVPVLIIRIVAG